MKRYILALLVGTLGLSGCASLVSTQVDKEANFNQYKTFTWLEPEVKVGTNPLYKSNLIDRNIRQAVEQGFAQRGIMRTTQQPDLLVQYHTYTEKKRQSYSNFNYGPFFPYGGWGYPFGLGWGRFYGWGFPYGGWGNGYNRSYTFTEGTLVLDVLDARTRELLWRGSIQGEVDNVKQLQRRAEKAAQAIMKKYPVPVTPELTPSEKPVIS